MIQELLGMSPSWWWTWLLSATLFAALALLVHRFGRRWPVGLRYGLILLALAKFAIPPLYVFGVAMGPLTPSSEPASGAPSTSPLATSSSDDRPVNHTAPPPSRVPGARPMLPTAGPVRVAAASDSSTETVAAWWPVVILVGGFVMVTLLFLQHRRVRGWVRSASPVHAASTWPDVWRPLLEQLSIRNAPRVLFSERVPAPLSAGLLQPVILLPASTRTRLEGDEWRTVLGHELTHHRHRDLWVQCLGLGVLAVWWFHPLAWLLMRALRQLQEDRCDDALIRHGIVRGEQYCETLLVVAARVGAPASPFAVAMGHPRHSLARRFQRLLGPSHGGRSIMPRWTLALLLPLGAALLPLGLEPIAQGQDEPTDANPRGGAVTDDDAFGSIRTALLAEEVTLHLGADGRVTIDGETYDRDLVTQAVRWARQKDPALEVRIEAGAKASIKDALSLMQALRDAGVKGIELVLPGEVVVEDPVPVPLDPESIEVIEEPPPPEPVERAEPIEVLEEEPAPLEPIAEFTGGGAATMRAVELGLQWLCEHQSPSGNWDSDQFDCDGHARCDGAGQPLMDVGVTGLSLMALLGSGQTHQIGPDRDHIAAALTYLQSEQQEDGSFARGTHLYANYNHAIATVAMVEAFHLSQDETLRSSAQKALNHVARCRNPYKAWRYSYPPDGDNDVSVTGWMLWALFAGQDAGLKIDANAIQDGMAFIEEMTDPETGRTGYHEKGSLPARNPEDFATWPADRIESMTALALMMRVFHGEDPQRSTAMRKGMDLLVRKPPRWNPKGGETDFYYWFYGSYAAWQFGGRTWDRWQHAMLTALVPNQVRAGGERGSWDPKLDPWGNVGGRVYATALNTLTLEVFYRYDRVVRDR